MPMSSGEVISTVISALHDGNVVATSTIVPGRRRRLVGHPCCGNFEHTTAKVGDMTKDFTVLVGTIGNGMWRSTDSGESFAWVNEYVNGISCNDMTMRGFGVDPHDPHHVLVATAIFETGQTNLGTAYGLHESFDNGANWSPIESFHRIECWRITFDPTTPGRYFVGTRPAGFYRTEDAGKSFDRLPAALPEVCPGIGLPRVTSISLHPGDPNVMLASVEIGGAWMSFNGGDSWEQVLTNVATPPPNGNVYGDGGRLDCHYSGFTAGRPDLALVSTPDGLYSSDDLGKTWTDFPVKQIFPEQYHREFVTKLDDPATIFLGIGVATNGSEGSLLRTRDRGASWDEVALPDECNSTVHCFAQHGADPDIILACTQRGMLFGSEDGGEGWTKYRWEFTEVKGMCWLPN